MSHNLMGNFQRNFQYNLFRREDGKINLTASMKDVYHDIVMEVLVNGDSLVIEAADVEFRKCPESFCINAAERLKLLVGVTIGRGLNRNIIESLGGGEGCGNLKNMLLTMLPLAMNVKAAEGFDDEESMMANIREKLRGTCAGYPVGQKA